jgi:peptide/nickel transport system permease protein
MPDGTSVPRHVLESLPPTLVLLGAATAVALAAGTLIGVSSVGRRRPRALAFNVVGFSMPAFYIGIVGVQLSLLLARVLGTRAVVLPSMGFGLDRHLILPVLALALRPTAEIARLTAESLSAEMTRDYVRTARAVGHPPRRVLLRHAWTNIVSAVMAAQGNAMRYLISSLVVVELLFRWPGLGRELALALTPRMDGRPSASILYDPHVVAGLCTALAALSLAVGLITTIAARRVDPRLRI